MYEGLCRQILTGPASEIVTLGGIRDFLDSLLCDSYVHEMTGDCIIVGEGITHKWLHILKQQMKLVEHQVAGAEVPSFTNLVETV